jgi:bifunctional DNA-binding transcriptional regulator/antitoxin component of YhaV-PrlF toxin-antitoxin module
MIVDIRQDVPDFLAYIRKRVGEHLATSKKLKKPEQVTRIDFGFEFGQGNELWLVFDTRPDAEPDGEWTVQVGKVAELKRPQWPIWHELPDDEVVFFIDLNGEQINVMKSPDKKICKIVGDAMKHALIEAREAGVFERLPKSERCELGVENMEGFYGWPKYKDRGKENLV